MGQNWENTECIDRALLVKVAPFNEIELVSEVTPYWTIGGENSITQTTY